MLAQAAWRFALIELAWVKEERSNAARTTLAIRLYRWSAGNRGICELHNRHVGEQTDPAAAAEHLKADRPTDTLNSRAGSRAQIGAVIFSALAKAGLLIRG